MLYSDKTKNYSAFKKWGVTKEVWAQAAQKKDDLVVNNILEGI